MTTAELTEVARFWTEFRPDSPEAQVIAGLQVALRAAEGQVVAMREDAARVAKKTLNEGRFASFTLLSLADTIADRIRALPAPATTTPFDAEAALVAMEQSIARRQHGPTPATRYEVYTAIQDALAAGRGGGR